MRVTRLLVVRSSRVEPRVGTIAFHGKAVPAVRIPGSIARVTLLGKHNLLPMQLGPDSQHRRDGRTFVGLSLRRGLARAQQLSAPHLDGGRTNATRLNT